MAHMNQAKKAKIAEALKEVMPKDWKYSLSVFHHSTIVLTIRQAPINLIKVFKGSDYFDPDTATHYNVNPYHYQKCIEDQEMIEQFKKIFDALNLGNWDRSDLMTDYFDVGHYVELCIGRWDKPFVVTQEVETI